MRESTFEQQLPAGKLKDIAIPYRGDGTPVTGGPHVYPGLAPSGLWTTPSDLAKYVIEVQNAVAGKSKLLTAAMAEQMFTPTLDHQGLGNQLREPRRVGISNKVVRTKATVAC